MSRDAIRFLADVAARPLSTTVTRYQRLNLSRRRGNAVRQHLAAVNLIDPIQIATRTGQVVLYELSDDGRAVCDSTGIDPGPRPRASLEHQFWVNRATRHFEEQGYEVEHEHFIKGNGAVDVLAQRPGERIAVEVETGKSDIKSNLANAHLGDFDRVVLVATSPDAVTTCQKAVEATHRLDHPTVELMTWLDFS